MRLIVWLGIINVDDVTEVEEIKVFRDCYQKEKSLGKVYEVDVVESRRPCES